MRIVVITTSRADWNGQGMVARALLDAGHMVTVLAMDWVPPDPGAPLEWIPFTPATDRRSDISLYAGTLVQEVARHSGNFDLAFINGDRYEALAAAYACALMDLPFAHLSGGDVTTGSQDNAYRAAITALATIHFPTNERAFERLARSIPFGLITLTGDPGIDRICSTPVMTRAEWLAKWSLPDNEVNPLVIFHPITRGPDPALGLDAMLKALDRIEKPTKAFVFLPNQDPLWTAVSDRLRNFASERHHWAQANMEPADFYACMTYCDFMIGNSSAGMHEAPLFGLPVVNIGDRQQGRVMARNVIRVDTTEDDIWWGITCALAARRIKIESPYGDGHACERIKKAITEWWITTHPMACPKPEKS